jgi:predicted metal-dependent peptidase
MQVAPKIEFKFDEEQDLRVKRAKIKLQKEKPFFSDLLFFMKIQQTDKVPTMGVDIEGNLYVSPEYAKKLSDEQLRGVLIHEVLHLALLHVQRGKNKRLNKGKLPPHMIWNLAIDCHANFIAMQNGAVLPNDIACKADINRNKVDIVALDQGKPKVIYSVQDCSKKTSEEIYIELYNNLPFEKRPGEFYVESDFGGQDVHYYAEGADGDKISEKAEREWKQRALNAIYRSKSIGNLPAGMERLINEMIEPQVPWQSKLYKFITDDIISDYTYMRPHKRSEAVGFYTPSFTKEKLYLAFFADTSGSIDDGTISEFKSEGVAILKSFENVEMIFGYCDADVQSVVEINSGDEEKLMFSKPKGGGGTDMRKILKWLEKEEKKPDVVVILTDGYTPWPTTEEVGDYKIMWVICENGISREEIVEREQKEIGEFVKMGAKSD